ncbi:pseudouridine synthase [Cerioporus squamosus]|nr:pseudouridine synthase [Cerioporus squamosus]
MTDHATQAQGKPFDFNAYPKRKIALKFTYNGIHYGGMEYQRDPGLPTVEGVLFDALVHTRLVDRAGGLEGCGWQRAGGRTRAMKQSSDAEPESAATAETSEDGPGLEGDFGLMDDFDEPPTNNSKPAEPPSAEVEFPYVFGLNHILPPTIRVLAWSPVSDEFSARFSRWRHYKYFFSRAGWTSPRSRFRNLCKVDASKQITVFTRRILSATIDRRADAHGDLYVFNLRGNAFLYNMVRHIMGILFRRLRPREAVGHDRAAQRGPREPTPAVPRRRRPPGRHGEAGLPDCRSAAADAVGLRVRRGVLDWRTDRASPKTGESTKSPLPGMICDLERATITAALDEHFLKAAEAHHKPPKQYFPLGAPAVPLGGGMVKRLGTYVNERYRLGPAPAGADEGDE